jgi:hypothetical protein
MRKLRKLIVADVCRGVPCCGQRPDISVFHTLLAGCYAIEPYIEIAPFLFRSIIRVGTLLASRSPSVLNA